MTQAPPTPLHGLLEVCDVTGRPIVLMPKANVLAQGLAHKSVCVALRDMAKRVCLVRGLNAEQWRLPGDSVFAFESAEDAALRVLRDMLGLTTLPVLTLRKSVRYTLSAQSAHPTLHRVFVSIPCAHIVRLDTRCFAESMFFDMDEIAGIHQHFTELLDDTCLQLI